MVIRKFALKYLDDVCKIEETCFSNPWSRESLENQLSIKSSRFYVAVEGGRAVGYVGMQILGGGGYITNIAVLPEYRGMGFGSALLEKLEMNKVDFITLEVRESNASAISLYEKFNYMKIGIRPNFYSNPDEDAVIMTKVLYFF